MVARLKHILLIIDSFRALENPKFILLDECDFFRKSEQEDVRFVTERYIGKVRPLHRDGINSQRTQGIV